MTISVDAVDDSFCSTNYTPEQLQQAYVDLEASILNTSGNVSLEDRFRSLFMLRNINTDEAAVIIGKAFSDDSALFKHEVAYVLGQMQCRAATPLLISVLADAAQEPMVRHEAAEALAAIGDQTAVEALQKYAAASPNIPEVLSDTCYLAIKKLQLERENPQDIPKSVFPGEIEFKSVDPAPPFAKCFSVATLKDILMDASRCLFERYRAMFSLRNKATTEAVLVLSDAIQCKSEGALYLHELAYVLGQLQHPASVPALSAVLADRSVAAIVRHECAEALGSIASPECFAILRAHAEDAERVVRESCIVALDMFHFETTGQ